MIDERIFGIDNPDELKKTYYYNEMTKALKSGGYKVLCLCNDANQRRNISTFLNNKDIIMKKITEIKNRTIQPAWHGIIFSSRAQTHFNADLLTDEKIKEIIEKGWLDEKYFKFPDVKVEETKNDDGKKEIDILSVYKEKGWSHMNKEERELWQAYKKSQK